jgi:protein gp37
MLGMRLKSVYPGIVRRVESPKGDSPFQFTGKIWLSPDALGEPLGVKTSCRYFVNSLSDLFYKEVPEWYIDAVFDVMEKADWHQFQLLTKRPDRMAAYTDARYKKKDPPLNIWLGASIEDQQAHDKRIQHLNRVRTAVRWISAEPCLGPIQFLLDGIDWLVLGGESGSRRPMKKEWAVDIRDQCSRAKVPFFFKQWGYFGEDGKKKPRSKPSEEKSPLTGKPPEKLEGAVYYNFPK